MNIKQFKETRSMCSMGVGCEESGICYAESQGEPDRCPNWKPFSADDGMRNMEECDVIGGATDYES